MRSFPLGNVSLNFVQIFLVISREIARNTEFKLNVFWLSILIRGLRNWARWRFLPWYNRYSESRLAAKGLLPQPICEHLGARKAYRRYILGSLRWTRACGKRMRAAWNESFLALMKAILYEVQDTRAKRALHGAFGNAPR